MAEVALDAPPLPEGVQDTILRLIDLCIRVFDESNEVGLIIWGPIVREEFTDDEFRARFARDIADAKWALGRFEGDRGPRFFDLLMDEFRLGLIGVSPKDDPDDIDHTLEIGEILVDSLQKFLEKFTYSALALSVIKEMIKLAKAVNKRMRA